MHAFVWQFSVSIATANMLALFFLMFNSYGGFTKQKNKKTTKKRRKKRHT